MANERWPLYLDVLRSLVRARIRYVVVGNFGLELFLRDAFALEVNDCDVVLGASKANLERAVVTLAERGWDVRAGGELVPKRAGDGLVDVEALAGKSRLVATRDKLSLDLLYEPKTLGWERITYAVADIEGVPVAAIETILALKDKSADEADRMLAAKVRAQIERGDLGPKRL